jgi:hypothetical protein
MDADGTSRAERKTGVVFVHGIGTQPPRETFLNWSEPIVRTLTALRREMATAAAAGGDDPAGTIGENPVLEARAEGDRVWAAIEIPAAHGQPADTWLITESYWAGEIRAPGLSDTLGYLRRHLRPIINGIAQGYGGREDRRVARVNDLMADAATSVDPDEVEVAAELEVAASRRWSWIELLDRVWKLRAVRWVLALFGLAVTTLALAVYAPLRALPIKAISERAELAALNAWLVDWFGDIPILLEDRVQAAMIRSRLEETIRWLVAERGCTDVVLVAHSGGAIVSFATLLRFAGPETRVRKLITHGQGLSLAWRLAGSGGSMPVGHPLRGDLGAAHPSLRWVDFWASYDPAPAGPLAPVDGSPLLASPEAAPPAGSPIRIESRPVTNLMHMGLDHSTYWDNDEGFLVPLIRHLDDPEGHGAGSRFYRSAAARMARIERRRRRVGLLLAWRWAAFATGVVATLLVASASRGLPGVGHDLAWAWAQVPGSDWVSAPIASVGGAVSVVLGVLGLSGLDARLGAAGPSGLGAAIPVLGTVLIYRRGVKSWHAADRTEREKIRTEKLEPAGEPSTKAKALLLAAGLAALLVASALAPRIDPQAAAVATLGVIAAATSLAVVVLGAKVGGRKATASA